YVNRAACSFPLPRPVRAGPASLLDWRVASAVVGRARGLESRGGPRKAPRIQNTVSDPNRTSRPDDSRSVAASRSCGRLLISVPRWCLPPTDCPIPAWHSCLLVRSGSGPRLRAPIREERLGHPLIRQLILEGRRLGPVPRFDQALD